MATYKFAKLVRDKIIDQQIAQGSKPAYRLLDANEHKKALVEKINEEAEEILTATPDDLAKEIADVQQALDDLARLCGVPKDEITKAQQAKNEKAGPFQKGIFVESVEVAENDPWIHYYQENPDRYPRIQ